MTLCFVLFLLARYISVYDVCSYLLLRLRRVAIPVDTGQSCVRRMKLHHCRTPSRTPDSIPICQIMRLRLYSQILRYCVTSVSKYSTCTEIRRSLAQQLCQMSHVSIRSWLISQSLQYHCDECQEFGKQLFIMANSEKYFSPVFGCMQTKFSARLLPI